MNDVSKNPSGLLSKLSLSEKVLSVAIACLVLFGAAREAYHHFYTDAEAETAHAALEISQSQILARMEAEQINNTRRHQQDRIDRHDREIARYERDLQTIPDLTSAQRSFIEREILRLEALKQCIREDRPQC